MRYNGIRKMIKGAHKMKTTYYRNGKKISKAEAIKWLGKERFESRVKEAKETFMADPWVQNEWMDGFMVEFN